jgi:hypothetical protein
VERCCARIAAVPALAPNAMAQMTMRTDLMMRRPAVTAAHFATGGSGRRCTGWAARLKQRAAAARWQNASAAHLCRRCRKPVPGERFLRAHGQVGRDQIFRRSMLFIRLSPHQLKSQS